MENSLLEERSILHLLERTGCSANISFADYGQNECNLLHKRMPSVYSQEFAEFCREIRRMLQRNSSNSSEKFAEVFSALLKAKRGVMLEWKSMQ